MLTCSRCTFELAAGVQWCGIQRGRALVPALGGGNDCSAQNPAACFLGGRPTCAARARTISCSCSVMARDSSTPSVSLIVARQSRTTTWQRTALQSARPLLAVSRSAARSSAPLAPPLVVSVGPEGGRGSAAVRRCAPVAVRRCAPWLSTWCADVGDAVDGFACIPPLSDDGSSGTAGCVTIAVAAGAWEASCLRSALCGLRTAVPPAAASARAVSIPSLAVGS